jgi:CHAD domain-containing protein
LRVEHVHQLRVGIRRIRSAVRSFRGWAPSPPAELVEGLRLLFGTLGLARDRDVLDDGVVAELAKCGAPPLAVPAAAPGPDPAAVVASSDAQRLFLAWITWRANLDAALLEEGSAVVDKPDEADAVAGGVMHGVDSVEEAVASRSAPDDAQSFRRNVERRLRRWHRRLVADWQSFDELDETSLHALRKRSKRQRYAVEFFAPLLKRRNAERYLNALTVFQDRMGELNDLLVARARYQSLVASDPAAWFALGWLAARIADVSALAKPELARLAKVHPPTA